MADADTVDAAVELEPSLSSNAIEYGGGGEEGMADPGSPDTLGSRCLGLIARGTGRVPVNPDAIGVTTLGAASGGICAGVGTRTGAGVGVGTRTGMGTGDVARRGTGEGDGARKGAGEGDGTRIGADVSSNGSARGEILGEGALANPVPLATGSIRFEYMT